MAAASRQQVRDALAGPVDAAGFDLEDVAVTTAGKRRVVRVVVDRDGGLDLDGVAELSRVLSAALDDSDVMGTTPYTLEVSSPGVDRPLTLPRHWRRAAGRLVRVTLADGRPITARVRTADDAAVTFDEAGAERVVPLDGLGPGKVQVEFDRPDEGAGPGQEEAQ